MSSANKEISRRFTELFSTGDETLARQILSPDVVFHGTADDGELRGIEEMMRFVAAYRRAFPDARSTVEDQVAEGDKVVTRWRAHGTHQGQLGPIAATSREFDMNGMTIERSPTAGSSRCGWRVTSLGCSVSSECCTRPSRRRSPAERAGSRIRAGVDAD